MPVTKKLDIIDAGIQYDIIQGGNKSWAHDFLIKWHGKGEAQIPDREKKWNNSAIF